MGCDWSFHIHNLWSGGLCTAALKVSEIVSWGVRIVK